MIVFFSFTMAFLRLILSLEKVNIIKNIFHEASLNFLAAAALFRQ